jgi:hypothetical protein
MFDRFNNASDVSDGGPAPDSRLQYAHSIDGGSSWTLLQPVRVETIVARMLVTPLAGDLFMMVMNDWANGTSWSVERKNVALW